MGNLVPHGAVGALLLSLAFASAPSASASPESFSSPKSRSLFPAACPAVPLHYSVGENCGGANCSGLLKSISTTGNGARNVPLSAATTFEYDGKGRLVRTLQNLDALPAQDIRYAYAAAGRLEQQVYPSGRVIRNCFDETGPVSAVREHQPAGATPIVRTYASGFQYRPSGQIATGLVGAVTESRTYNVDERLESLYLSVGSNPVWAMTNHYCGDSELTLNCANSNGNIYRQVAQQPTPTGTQTFDWRYSYDRLNRIANARELNSGGNAWEQVYGYDRFGNRWVTGTKADANWTPGGASWYHASNNQIVGYGYDGAGNLISLGAGSHAFQWDAEGRKVEDAITTSVTRYFYDGEGRRVKRITADGKRTYSIYDGMGRLVAEHSDGAGGQGRQFLHTDGLGSTRVVTTEAATVISRRDYFPFGEEIEAGLSYSNGRDAGLYGTAWNGTIRFTGKERDQGPMEWRNDYFAARYMSAAQGRFTSPDIPLLDQNPGDPQSWNLYSYVRNNPLIFTDPTGNDCVYVNSGNDGISSIDNQTNAKGCGKTGGYWVDGTVTNARFAYGSLILTGTTDGTNRTSASYGLGPDPGPLALQRGTQLAAPGVNLVGQGLVTMAAIAAPLPTALVVCAAGNCNKGDIAMAMLPEIGALKAGGTLLKLGVASGKGAEIIQKAGGAAQAAKDFAALGGTEVINGGVRIRTLSDGTRAALYTATSTGEASIAIQEAGRTVSKIRY
jgi:RHS repeat-associated protein